MARMLLRQAEAAKHVWPDERPAGRSMRKWKRALKKMQRAREKDQWRQETQ